MREAGYAVTTLPVLAGLVLLWFAHVTTFESNGEMAGYEGTPNEGWEHWNQKKFWHDLWAFSLYATFALCAFVLPLVATIRTRFVIKAKRNVDRWLAGLSLLFTLLAVGLLLIWLPSPVMALIPFVFTLGGFTHAQRFGCVFAAAQATVWIDLAPAIP